MDGHCFCLRSLSGFAYIDRFGCNHLAEKIFEKNHSMTFLADHPSHEESPREGANADKGSLTQLAPDLRA